MHNASTEIWAFKCNNGQEPDTNLKVTSKMAMAFFGSCERYSLLFILREESC